MLIKAEARQIFVDLQYERKVCAQLKRDTWDDEFLVSRIIFLTTYGTNPDLAKLIEEYGLAETITKKIARHAELATKGGEKVAEPMQDMALVETLKLMFNVTHFCKAKVDSFAPAIPHVLTLLTKRNFEPSKPLDGPFSPLVNSLFNLELDKKEAQASLFPENGPEIVVAERLIEIFDLAMKNYGENELEHTVTPLVSVLRLVYDSAPDEVKIFIRGKLLPTAEDRREVLGRGETLPARLLRNLTNALAPQLREAISHFVFEMSDKDASKFVDNVGYGYASGFLFQNDIPVPKNAAGAENGASSRPVNPVTGQYLDQESGAKLPEMTDEEKEREAERLFVLFERYVRYFGMSHSGWHDADSTSLLL